MFENLVQDAIKAALAGKWQKAIQLNKIIIEKNPRDIESLNRLTLAYTQIGDFSAAKKTCHQVLNINRYNLIAKKNLLRLPKISSGSNSVSPKNAFLASQSPAFVSNLFLEQPGKTKIVDLVNLASPKILSSLQPGEEVIFKPRKRRISIFSLGNIYLGAIPDNLSIRLIYLLKSGNRYQSFVKANSPKSLQIFIREIKRGKKAADISSFTLSGLNKYYSSVRREALKEQPLITAFLQEE